MIVVADRVVETTATTGVGTYALASVVAPTFNRVVDKISDGVQTPYRVRNGVDFEVGLGTVGDSGTTITRNTILDSSNAGAAVDWPAGDKEFAIVSPAAFFPVYADTDPTVSDNPMIRGAKRINRVSGVEWICTDNTAGENVWRGSDGTVIGGVSTDFYDEFLFDKSFAGIKKFYGTAGRVVGVLSGNDISVTSGNGTALGYASFDGTQSIELLDTDFDVSQMELTLKFRRLGNSDIEALVSGYGGSAGEAHLGFKLYADGHLTAFIDDGTTWSSVSSVETGLNDGIWHTAFAVFDLINNTIACIVDDGTPAVVSNVPYSSVNTNNNLFVGRDGNANSSNNFNGDMAAVRIYPGILTSLKRTAIAAEAVWYG